MKTKPMVMLLTMLAGWMNRQQQEIIEYLKAENAILRDELQKATGWNEFDVTSLITGDGTYSFVLKGDATSTQSFNSDSGANPAVLSVTY
jgi:hypothetical protein